GSEQAFCQVRLGILAKRLDHGLRHGFGPEDIADGTHGIALGRGVDGADSVPVVIGRLLWSAKLSLPSPLRGCEVLELAVDLVHNKRLWIKSAPRPVNQPMMLGVLGVPDACHQTRKPPDAPTTLGRAGGFPRETGGVALPRLQRQDFFHEQLVLPAIPE